MNPTAASIDVRRQAEEAAALYPALLVEAERIAKTVAAGMHGRRRAGPGETFWQHRAYAFGDPVSAIDWRQSARTNDRLYVRENEWEAAAAVYLWRDPSHSLNYSSIKDAPTKRRRADILAVALAILLSQAGERIGLLGEARQPFYGRTAPTRLLEALHIGEYADDIDGPPPSDLPPGAHVVMLSDFFTPLENIETAVSSLAARGAQGALVQICDAAEEEFPFAGRVEFQDLESRDKLIFGEAMGLGAAYKEKFAAHRDAIGALASRNGWTLITHRTDRPAQAALLSLYTALAGARMRAF